MLFKLSQDFVIDTDSAPWKTEGLRIGLWGGPGSGKSSTAALFAEQFLSQGGTVVIFEPRAEYHTLKEKWDVVVCGGPYAKDIDFVASSPGTYAKAVVERGVSIVFYTTDVEDEAKLIEFVSRFLHYLLKYNEVVKRPIMLIIEETHEQAPSSTKGRVSPPWVFSRMIKAFKTTCVDARKLNIVPIALSPRPQEVNFTIRQLCNLNFYGKFSPQDVHYIESQCLKYYEHSFYKGRDLLDLKTGQFAIITSGQALPLQTITQPRLTKHGAETPKLTYITPHKEETKNAVTDLVKTISEALERERQEQSELDKLKSEHRTLQKEFEELSKDHEQLKLQAETLGKITIQTPAPKAEDVTFIDKVKSDTIAECAKEHQRTLLSIRNEIIDVFNQYTEQPKLPLPESSDIYKIWEPKMPSPCARRIFKFLLTNKGAKYTKAQIGVSLGYKVNTGTFNSALSFLRRNSLIKTEGNLVWVGD